MQDDRRFVDFQQAIARLEESLAEPQSGMARDSSIKRFELCFELSWWLFRTTCGSRAWYAALHETVSPRLFSYGLLADDRLWARLPQDRNLSVHTYNEELAEQVYGQLPDYLPALRHLSDAIDADRTPLGAMSYDHSPAAASGVAGPALEGESAAGSGAVRGEHVRAAYRLHWHAVSC